MSHIEEHIRQIRRSLNRIMRKDRVRITGELRLIERNLRNPEKAEKNLARINGIRQRLEAAIGKKERRKAGIPFITYPSALPITSKRKNIIEAIRHNRVVIITGETGSGKTTQIPKMCVEAGRGIDGLIGCTQPRRVAAITVTKRIAEELGESMGISAGYKIRFEDKTSPGAYIKIMTDGILLMEAQTDPFLNDYDTIIVDEAHERSLNIDFGLGILKTLTTKRKDLKIIITSATIDTEKFSRAFDDAPVIEVSGRMYPVDIRYEPLMPDGEKEKEDVTHVDAAVSAVKKIENESDSGDILIFMPTEKDIRETCDLLEARSTGGAVVLPMYARLTSAEQQQVFQPTLSRKIVVATNVAETSITIPGIRYVIDTGLARISQYNPRSRTTSLPVQLISRSSADQRAGRCGRVEHGVCIRLYSPEDYESQPLFTPPEILRSNLAEVILRMLALKIGDVNTFPFIDRPAPRHIKGGVDILEELGAIQQGKNEAGNYELTERGRRMARLPLDPRISRMIHEAQQEGCLQEIAVIAAALSVQDPRERPLEKEKDADRVHESFRNPSSDFITLLNIWNRYQETAANLKTAGRIRKFCRDHFLSFRRMKEWRDIYEQIMGVLEEEGMAGRGKTQETEEPQDYYTRIHRAVLSGYLSNIAVKKEKNFYTAAGGKQLMLFPGSGLFNRGGNWIVAAEMVETTRLFARMAANIESDWLEPLTGELCRYTWSNPHWEKKREEVIALEQVSLYGLVIIPERRVSYGLIHPEEASRIFIRAALVAGEMERSFPFLKHNRDLIEGIARMEDKLRRRNLLVGEDVLSRFYEERLDRVYDARTLQKIIRERGGDHFLRMTEEDVLRYAPDEGAFSLYPDVLVAGEKHLALNYRFDPGKADDGVTLKVSTGLLHEIRPETVDWAVPGLLSEKIAMLIKGLPKEYRKKLLPIGTTLDVILNEMPRGGGTLVSVLTQFIYRKFGVDIPAAVWPLEQVPDHLKIRLSVVDHKNRELISGRDIRLLQTGVFAEEESQAFNRAAKKWETTGLADWTFGDLPENIDLAGTSALEGCAYPALAEEGHTVSLRLFRSRWEAGQSHLNGVRALYEIRFAKELVYLRKHLTLQGDLKTCAHYFGGPRILENALYNGILERLFAVPVRTREAFTRHAESVKSRILTTGQAVLKETVPFLTAYHETRMILHDLEKAHRTNRTAQTFLASLRDSMEKLMPEDLLKRYSAERLLHMPRYLKAIAIRADRGLTHLDKDRRRAEEILPFEDRMGKLISGLTPSSSNEKREAVEELRWMIEEYRVSLFAQELKTASPISEKRLRRKIEEIERMV